MMPPVRHETNSSISLYTLSITPIKNHPLVPPIINVYVMKNVSDDNDILPLTVITAERSDHCCL